MERCASEMDKVVGAIISRMNGEVAVHRATPALSNDENSEPSINSRVTVRNSKRGKLAGNMKRKPAGLSEHQHIGIPFKENIDQVEVIEVIITVESVALQLAVDSMKLVGGCDVIVKLTKVGPHPLNRNITSQTASKVEEFGQGYQGDKFYCLEILDHRLKCIKFL